MRNGISLLALAQVATGVITSRRFVTPAAAVAGAGVNAQGVAQSDAAIGDSYRGECADRMRCNWPRDH
jgi:hypothetical protein